MDVEYVTRELSISEPTVTYHRERGRERERERERER